MRAIGWTYGDCTQKDCSYSISMEAEYDHFLPIAVEHMKTEHGKTDAEIINTAWYKILGGSNEFAQA